MNTDSNSQDLSFPENEKEITVVSAITEYLKTRQYRKKRKNRPEIWFFKQFRTYIEDKMPNVKIREITDKDRDRFLDSFSVSLTTRATYASRMNGFLEYARARYIDLSEPKSKKNPEPENPKLVILKLENIVAKKDKDLDSERARVTAHSQTIDEKNAEIERMKQGKQKECSQCPKIAPLTQKNEADKATFDKEIEKYRITVDKQQSKINTFVSNSGEIEEIEQLEAQKAEKERKINELDEEIAKRNKIMENRQIVKVLCPVKSSVHYGSIVSFGNDCLHCEKDYVLCPKYDELTNPDRA